MYVTGTNSKEKLPYTMYNIYTYLHSLWQYHDTDRVNRRLHNCAGAGMWLARGGWVGEEGEAGIWERLGGEEEGRRGAG